MPAYPGRVSNFTVKKLPSHKYNLISHEENTHSQLCSTAHALRR